MMEDIAIGIVLVFILAIVASFYLENNDDK